MSSDTHQSCASQNAPSVSVSEAQRYTSLYFALCTKVTPLSSNILALFVSLFNCWLLVITNITKCVTRRSAMQKHSLFREIFLTYKSARKEVKQVCIACICHFVFSRVFSVSGYCISACIPIMCFLYLSTVYCRQLIAISQY